MAAAPGMMRLLAVPATVLLAGAAQAQIVCLPIDRVQVDDARIISATNVQQIVAPYEGRCLGLEEFDEILERITLAYVDNGYILSRAYLPEQDLTRRVLSVKVVEGALSGIEINGEPRPRWSGMVFPGLIGKPVNIREVEQGLDQIEEMPRWTAELAFEAGAAPGDSLLTVAATTPKPYQIKLTTDNRGNEQTGLWNTGVSGDFTNLLGINDTWTWGVGKSVGPGALSLDYAGDSNRNANFGLTVPYGRWSFSFEYTWSDYQLTIPGAATPIITDGWSTSQSIEARYLYDRDQTTKEYLSAELTRAVNENYIQDVLIDTSSRTLTDLKLAYSITRPLGSGSVEASVFVQKGLSLFGAEDAASLPAGSPNPQYTLIGFDADYSQRIGDPALGLTWSSTASGQWSADRLYGGQTFAIGGVSTVRGSKIALASGSSGILWRNELDYEVLRGRTSAFDSGSLYAALDVGHVFGQDALGINAATAIGSAVGFKLNNDNLALDVSYQQMLSVSDGLQQPEGEIFVSLEIVF